MTLLQKLSAVAISAAVVTVAAHPASAITLSIGGTQVAGQGYTSSVSGATTINFNNGVAPTSGIATYSAASGTPAIVQGSLDNQYAAPTSDNSNYLAISPQGSNVVGATGPVTINFNKALDYFGLYWGSLDTYNYIDFYSNGKLLQAFTGTDVGGSNAKFGDHYDASANFYANFFADQGQTFDEVVLGSNGVAFESDNHAYRAASVPEPNSMVGLLAIGTFGVSVLLKRRREQSA